MSLRYGTPRMEGSVLTHTHPFIHLYINACIQQKKVVIKYVIKSRILVDCWTRDRKLGMVPAEIHILHTLRKIPHDNCGDMGKYFFGT